MKILKNGMYLILVLLLSTTISCHEDDEMRNTIGGLDFVIATLNAEGNKTGVLASTVPGDNRTVYTVDFGATADDDTDVFQTSAPMVTYDYPEETVTYTITVTASLEGAQDVSITKEHTVTFVVAPPSGGGGGGDTSAVAGTWRLAPESGAFGVGPALNDVSWFSSSADDVTTRACLFDDEYVFGADGSFQNILGTETWVEAWQGAAGEACGAPVAPHDGTATATYTYDEAAGTITINGVSKAFAMTGWRIGFLGGPEPIARACNKMQGQITSGANCIAQRAVITALEADPSKVQYMVDEFKVRRDLILKLLNNIEGFSCNTPEGAFYVFPDVSAFYGKIMNGNLINNATDFSLYLLEAALVATVTGDAFGNPNCIRISYAASQDQIIEAINRIKKAVS